MSDVFDKASHLYAERQRLHGIAQENAADIELLHTENRELRAEIELLRHEREYYRAAFESISNARWWKLTAPLRRMTEQLRRLFHPRKPVPLSGRVWPETDREETVRRRTKDTDARKTFGIVSQNRSEALKRSLEAQTYPAWQWGSEGSDYTLLLSTDCELHPYALSVLAETLESHELVYGDELFEADGKEQTLFRFAFSPYSLRSSCDLGTVLAVRSALFASLPTDCGGIDRLLLLCDAAESAAHIPAVLCRRAGAAMPVATEEGCEALQRHLQRHGLSGTVTPTEDGCYYHVAYEIVGAPMVSIVIPNWEHLVDISVCLDSIYQRSTYPNFEIILVRNGQESEEISAYYAAAEKGRRNLRMVSYTGEFNYSAVCNAGVKAAKGEYVLLLNNDVEVITPAWIEEMLMLAQQQDVGIVGAKLLYPNETVQHCGMAFTSPKTIEHLFRGASALDPGPLGFLCTMQEVTAVTGACVLLRRSLYETLGGLDEGYAVYFSDVDLCMKTREAGYRILCTPFSCLYHMEGSSCGTAETPEKEQQFLRDSDRFFARWGKWSKKGDLFVNLK